MDQTSRAPAARALGILVLGVLTGCSFSTGGSSSGADRDHDAGAVVFRSNGITFAGDSTLSSDSGIVAIQADVSDDAGGDLDYAWRVLGGPEERVAFSSVAADGDTEARFPLVGTYSLELTAQAADGRSASRGYTITIRDRAGFTLQLDADDMIAEQPAPLRRLPVVLYWRPFPDQPLRRGEIDIHGLVRFSGLADDPAAYDLRVPTN